MDFTIAEYVEKYFKGEINFGEIKDKKKLYSTKLDKYKYNTVIRLLIYWEKYLNKKITKLDFLLALRNYLLVFKISMNEIGNFDEEDYKDVAIKKDSENKIFCVIDTPKYMDSKILEQGFMKNIKVEKVLSNKYILNVSPFITKLTGFEEFKSIEQKLAVTGALNTPNGYTTLVALQTGGGKSLITQSIAYQNGIGLTIVVVPTVSLAIDQVRAAQRNILHDTNDEIQCYYSGIIKERKNKIFSDIKAKKLKLLFISPEALIKNKMFKDIVKEANDTKYLRNIVIDEAHIVIEWGSFFRVDYQCLEPWRKALADNNAGLRTILLSATFGNRTIENLKSMFTSEDKWIEIRCDKLRKEPRFQLVKAHDLRDKRNKIVELIKCLPHPLIVYVSAPYEAKSVKELLMKNNITNLELFTGATKSNERERIIKDWSDDNIDIIIATSAFGVGVDKNDVRSVLHLYIPSTPNEYYQELGRGGRDGLPSLSVMCIIPKIDLATTRGKLEKVLSPEKILVRWTTMLNSMKSKRSHGIYSIDTSIKPNYNDDDYYYDDYTSEMHKRWNIYVVLLFRRAGLIKIVDIVLASTKFDYIIMIEILDSRIINSDDKSLELITQIRDEEWMNLEHDFNLIKKGIVNSGILCWSEMFCRTYNLVSEYCGGCNKHNKIINVEPKRFSLLKDIPKPFKVVDDRIKKLWRNTNEIFVLLENENFQNLADIINKGINLIIVDNINNINSTKSLLSMLDKESNANIIGFKELEELLKKNSFYYLSGSAVVLYDENSKKIYDKIVKIQKIEKACKLKVIHVFKSDLKLDSIDKRVSSIIDGPKIDYNLIERM